MSNLITKARIVTQPKAGSGIAAAIAQLQGGWNGSARVEAQYGTDKWTTVFDFYHDEIIFSAIEFVGKTTDEALQLFHDKDVRYLQS